MITKIVLSNFRSHKLSVFDCSPGINSFIGITAHGKTTVIKALLFVLKNRPLGTGFYPDWLKTSGSTRVEIHTERGWVALQKEISYSKSSKKSLKNSVYSIKIGDSPVVEFSVIGSNVPSEVSEFLNISDLNIQTQHDQEFILDKNSYSDYLKRILSLDKSEAFIKTLNSDLSFNKRLLIAEREKLSVANDKLKSFAGLNNLILLNEKYQKIQTLKLNINKKILTLSYFLEDYDSYQVERANFGVIKSSKKNLLKIEKNRSRIEAIKKDISDLLSIKKYLLELSNFGIIKSSNVFILKIEKNRSRIEAIKKDISDLKLLIHLKNELHRSIIDFENYNQIYEKKYKGKSCPLCGKRI